MATKTLPVPSASRASSPSCEHDRTSGSATRCARRRFASAPQPSAPDANPLDSGFVDVLADAATVRIVRDSGIAISPYAFGNNYYDWVDWSNDGTNGFMGTEVPVRAMHLGAIVANNNTDMNSPEIFDNAHIDAFITYCWSVGAEPIMEVPLLANNVDGGAMTAQAAADMVTYVNGTKGYGVTYWTIGDEADLYVSGNILGDPSSTLGPNNPNRRPRARRQVFAGDDWLTPFLDGCKDDVDVVTVHAYGVLAACASLAPSTRRAP